MFEGNRISEMKRKLVDYSSHDSPYRPYVKSMEWERLVEKQGEDYSLDQAYKLRSLRVEIRICKANNNKLIEA